MFIYNLIALVQYEVTDLKNDRQNLHSFRKNILKIP